MKGLYYILLILLFITSSCKTQKVDFAHLEKNGEVILTMERTPCFGSCPVYDVKLYHSGLLLYHGKRYTDYRGCHYAKVSKEEVTQLTNYIQSAGFFGLENKYPVSERAPTDLPGCLIYFKSGTMEKRIEDDGWETPQILTKIEKTVDSLVASKKLHFCDK